MSSYFLRNGDYNGWCVHFNYNKNPSLWSLSRTRKQCRELMESWKDNCAPFKIVKVKINIEAV